MTDIEIEISERELDELKKAVLIEKVQEISEQLGDPGRYFASFRAKDLLNQSDCEEIKAAKISIERARLLIEKVHGLRGRHNEHPYDVFVAALKRMRVHVQIVRILNTCLAQKKAELLSTKRSEMAYKEEFLHDSNGFPSNGASQPTPPGNTPEDQVNSRGPSLRSSTSSTSSPVSSSMTSSSSSIATTPPSHLTSPHTDTDGSLLSPPQPNSFGSRQSSASNHLPTLPVGFDRHGRRISKGQEVTQTSYSRADSQTTPTISEVSQEADPIPTLPPGYGNDGRKKDDVSELISPPHVVHPNYGPVPSAPNTRDELVKVQRSHTSPSHQQDELSICIKNYEMELKHFQDLLAAAEAENQKLKQQNKELLDDNKSLNAIKNQLESHIRILQDSAHPSKGGALSGGVGAVTPHGYSQFPSWSQSPGSLGTQNYMLGRKRNTEPYMGDVRSIYHNGRQSEPTLLNVPVHLTRPNKLPLKNMRGGSNSNPNSYSVDRSPMHDIDRHPRYTHHSPSSDSSPRDHSHLHARVSSSADDLTSGGEDKSSIRSFESGNSFTGNNFTLAGQGTTETIV